MPRAPEPCPRCDAPLRAGGRFCKACGWDADLDESEHAYLDDADVPDAFDDDEYARVLEEAGLAPRARTPREVLWAVVAIVTTIAFFLVYALWPHSG